MARPPEELAEDVAVHLLPRRGFETIDRGELFFEASARRAGVHRLRLGDVAAAVAWARSEALRRGVSTLQWWVGWHAEPGDLGERLLELGLEPDDPPELTGMTSTTAPPPVPGVEVRRIETADELLAALEVDWEVWGMERADRLGSAAVERERFDPAGSVHHFAAFLDGRRIGFARAVDMHGAVALMGGTVLREARGRGAYRALVRARWEHAAARGTPLLVVQAGDLSGPVLARLGFVTHGVVRVYADPGVGSGHGDD